MAECEYTEENRYENDSRIFLPLFSSPCGFSISEGQNTSTPTYTLSIPLPSSQIRVERQKSESGRIPGLQSHNSDKSKSNTSSTYHSASSVSRECGQEVEIWLDPERASRIIIEFGKKIIESTGAEHRLRNSILHSSLQFKKKY